MLAAGTMDIVPGIARLLFLMRPANRSRRVATNQVALAAPGLIENGQDLVDLVLITSSPIQGLPSEKVQCVACIPCYQRHHPVRRSYNAVSVPLIRCPVSR